MAKPFRPGFWTDANRLNPHAKWIERPTYRQLLKELPALMKEYDMPQAIIFRSRRGEWGEWFEYWHYEGGKIRKGRQGWN